MNNIATISKLIYMNPNFSQLTIQGDVLQLNERKINIANINLDEIATRHDIYNNATRITPEEFFNLCLFCANNVVAFTEFIKLNPNLNELNIINNILHFKDKNINISKIYIGDLAERIGLINRISEFNSEQLFNLLELYTNKQNMLNIEELVYSALTNNDSSKTNLIITFNNLIFKVMEFKDYLDPDFQRIYNEFLKYIEELQKNPDKLNNAQQNELRIFNESLSNLEEKTRSMDNGKKLALTNNVSANGYINMFLITILTIASGITLGAMIFLKLKF